MTDIVSLRTLFVSGSADDAARVRQGADLTTVPIDFSHITEPTKAVTQILTEEVDLVLIDEAVPAASRAAIVQAAQTAPRRPVTLLMMANPGPPGDMPDATPDGVIPKPGSVEAATKTLAGCARLRVPSKALVVDDSSTMRGIVKKILSQSRFPIEASEVEEGLAALREIGSGNFDFVMLDYNMPGLNGVETLAEIKRRVPHVEVVMISATPDDDIAQKARAAGAAAFLKKPFYPADIDTVLLRMCGVRPLR